jgi:hypothetical protein
MKTAKLLNKYAGHVDVQVLLAGMQLTVGAGAPGAELRMGSLRHVTHIAKHVLSVGCRQHATAQPLML